MLNPKFDGKGNTNSRSSKELLRKVKYQNGVPRSRQPNNSIKPNTPEEQIAGLAKRNVKHYAYTNSRGKKVVIRQDKPANYNQGGVGNQGRHYNAGQNPQQPKDLNQHHNH